MTLWNDLPETREESEPWRCLRAGRREAGVVLFQSRAICRREKSDGWDWAVLPCEVLAPPTGTCLQVMKALD